MPRELYGFWYATHMKQSFLRKLQYTALLNLSGALVLLLVVPALQLLVLSPQGYGTALATPQTGLAWIQGHVALFLLYRLTLILGFALLLGLPFALFRIIVAQEIVGRAELVADEEKDKEEPESVATEADGMPAFAWRGKGFAVIAAWTGLPGLALVVGGTLASTVYLWSSAGTITSSAPLPGNFAGVSGLFTVLTYTLGIGLLALSCIFFGIVIVRSGRRLWPDSWVVSGYFGTAIGAIACGSAVQVALAPTSGQAGLTTPAILLFAIWSLWFSLMVVRLKPE
jgi:hypothetical protein